MGNSEIRPLTGLRGIAACWVVIFHFRGNEAEGYTGQIVKHGYLAVDVFFVLSGLVMALSYKHLFQKGFSGRHYVTFLIRRLARIWPLYAVATLIYTVLYIGGFGSNRIPSIMLPHLLPLNLGMVQAWGIGESIDRPAWSISTEFAAYLLFPLLASLTVFSRGIVAILLGVSAFLGLGLLAAFAQPRGLSGPLDLAESSNTIWPLLRCLSEFSLGLITYRVALIPAARRLAGTSAFLWLQVSIILVLLTLRGTDLLIVAFVPPLLLQLAFCDTVITRFFGCAQVYFLGQISYAIYLLHWGLLPIQKLSHLLVDRLGTVIANVVTMCFIYSLLLAGATLAYRVIEMPCRRWIKNIGVRFDPGEGNAVHQRVDII